MEVIVHSTLPTVGGQVTVATDPNQSVDSLITAFCVEKGIQHRGDFVLRTRDQEMLANTRPLSACGVLNGDCLFLGTKVPVEEWVFGCNQWWVLAAVTLLIGCVGIVAVSLVRARGSVTPDQFGVVLDAGSSHTTVYVYKWPGEKTNGTGMVHQIHSCETKGGGISSYVSSPAAAGDSLRPCLDQAVRKVPAASHADSAVYLGATAGMRLLRDSDNKTESHSAAAILAAVRATLADYPFNFSSPETQARILSGREEGTFSWITVNFLKNALVD